VAAGRRLAAYYCLAAGCIARERLPGRLRRNAPEPIPVIVLGRLAVDRDFKGRGLGSDLLADALHRSVSASGTIGVRAVIVHPLTPALIPFHDRIGFARLPGDSLAMFIAMEEIAKARA
jgi:predicted N-acetyltransferase YhbS